MPPINLTTVLHIPVSPEGLLQSVRQLASIADEYRKDPEFRSNLSSDPVAALSENSIEVVPDTEVRIVEDTDEVFHFILPPDFNASVGDEVLNAVAGGGKTASSATTGPGYGGPRGPSCGCGASCIDAWTSRGGSGSI